MNKGFKAKIYGRYSGRSDYSESDEMISIKNYKASDLGDWFTFEFCAIWEAPTLRELQEIFWRRFHGRITDGLWFFQAGKIKDNNTGRVWNVNDWGRKEA